ncbi:MAG: acylphosphatase [Pseudomonadota bacterium]
MFTNRICRQYHVSGIVQGVFFRASTLQQAIEFNLTGWVKNLPDGRVEAVACGEATNLEKFEQWLHQGPEQAQVSAVEVNDMPVQDFSGFLIK